MYCTTSLTKIETFYWVDHKIHIPLLKSTYNRKIQEECHIASDHIYASSNEKFSLNPLAFNFVYLWHSYHTMKSNLSFTNKELCKLISKSRIQNLPNPRMIYIIVFKNSTYSGQTKL